MIVWLDTAAFTNHGGWKLDTQFVLQMGQGYLLAAGKPGVPVSAASADFRVPASGRYRVWARVKNWLREYSPGRFQVAIDQTEGVALLGGLPTEEWVWEIAGDFDLDAERGHQARLIDRTGYYARCAALVITDEMDFTPPQPVDALLRLRAKLLGIPIEPMDGGTYDVIVVGGGPAGVPAAIASARAGQRTLLFTGRPTLGGNAAEEAGVGFDGASSRQPHAREGGIAEELRRLRDHDGISWQKALRRLAEDQPNLTLLYNMALVGADAEDDTIRSVIARDTGTLRPTRFAARMFIDCTGDGWLGYFAGARYRVGREAAWEFGETLAPETSDNVTMSGCLMGGAVGFKAEDTGAVVGFDTPEWCYRFPPGREWNRYVTGVHGHWWLEHQGSRDDLFEAEKARDELMRISLSFFGWLKHDWERKELAAKYDIMSIPFYDAKRENRRFVGDYVLNERDCVEGRTFPDTIGHTGWTIDVHHPLGVFSGKEGPFHANMHIPMVSLPYRCLYSKNIKNMLMAGRNISVTHVALGTARVQNTIAVAAQAAGTAAAIANQRGTTPRGVCERHLDELRQALLRGDQYIPGVKNEDPRDLALSATVRASSALVSEPYSDTQGVPGEWKPLDVERCAMLPRGGDEHIGQVWLYLKNEGSDAWVTARFRKERDPGLFWQTEDIAVDSQAVTGGFEGWMAFTVNRAFGERYLWMILEPAAGVSWRAMDMAPLDWFKGFRRGGGYETDGRWGMMVRLAPPCAAIADCSPGQVINGYGRVVSPDHNMWVSETLPAWLELSWPEPQAIRTILLTFDTDMNNPPMTFPMIPIHPRVVTDFTVEALSDGGWREVAVVSESYQRRVVVRCDETAARAIRVNIRGTGGEAHARVIEVRCYEDSI
ncbi:MAG: FAD-dependent oxidoreductase [Oscillospiraceae bacterium]|jgi:hypothetical protein|nr:FAD-dependent oxidoreductase [Oscillospiraceae bacterium]